MRNDPFLVALILREKMSSPLQRENTFAFVLKNFSPTYDHIIKQWCLSPYHRNTTDTVKKKAAEDINQVHTQSKLIRHNINLLNLFVCCTGIASLLPNLNV